MKEVVINSQTFYIAESFLEKSQGVIGRETLATHGAFIVPSCNWVHSFFLTQPLYIYFLSKDFREILREERLFPNRLSSWVIKASHVVESTDPLPRSIFAQCSTQLSSL